jgi:hypothetical protein
VEINFKWNTRLMFKLLRCTIIDPNIEKLSQQVLLDYNEDQDTDENESSAVEEEEEDEEENEGVDEDCKKLSILTE